MTGLVVLAFLPFMSVLEDLPAAVLGASIIMAVRTLITVRPFLEYRRYTRLQFSVALVTFALTIALAPHVERAVVAGVVLAIGAHLGLREMLDQAKEAGLRPAVDGVPPHARKIVRRVLDGRHGSAN